MRQSVHCLEIFTWAVCCLGYVFVIDSCCKKYLEISRRREMLFAACLIVCNLIIDVAAKRSHIPYIAYVLPYHIILIGLIIWMFRAQTEKKIAAASVLTASALLLTDFWESLLSCLTLLFLHVVEKVPEPFLSAEVLCVIVIVSSAFCLSAIVCLSDGLASVFRHKTKKWYVQMSLPLLAVIALMDVIDWGASNGILVRGGYGSGLYRDQIFSHAGICIVAALLLFATGSYVFGMERIYVEQRKSGQYYAQIAAYRMLEEQYRESERLRHDLKNHVIALTGLLENREWERMRRYLRDMEDAGGLAGAEELTGNSAVDGLLCQKRKMAAERKIVWESDILLPEQCGMDEFDLCVLFGNLLDNAVEACERLQCGEKRFINVRSKIEKGCLLLEVKNSVGVREQSAEKRTRKKNPERHGIGLLNVGDIVRKYDGVMHTEASDGVFTVSVLVPMMRPDMT